MSAQIIGYDKATAHSDADRPQLGRFDLAIQPKEPGLRDTLVTSLLVLLPTLATVAAIVAGLVLTGGNGI